MTNDFSLVQGGPLFQLFRRTHLSGDALELLRRRIVVIACFAWIPILLLSLFSGHALGGVAIPFFYDIETHVRFLVALPILIAAELFVHLRLRPIIQQFVDRRIIDSDDLPKFHEAVKSTARLRNSVVAEITQVVLVYTVGIWVWRNEIALGQISWYAIPDGTQMRFTLAGHWFRFISVPIFQFILLRWYFRFFLWLWFLFRVSRLKLRLVPIHPDRTAGLGFLGASIDAFSPVLIAQGALLAGLIANQIFYAGENLINFKVQIAGFVGFFILAMLVPLTVFTPVLARLKQRGRLEFGMFASRYVTEFQKKWVKEGGSTSEPVLGSADIQSLADLGNSNSFVLEMRIVPFALKDVARLAAITVLPFIPLTLTIFSLEELISYLVKAIF